MAIAASAAKTSRMRLRPRLVRLVGGAVLVKLVGWAMDWCATFID